MSPVHDLSKIIKVISPNTFNLNVDNNSQPKLQRFVSNKLFQVNPANKSLEALTERWLRAASISSSDTFKI